MKSGETIGAYVIERPLGRGAMGVVYLARHEELGHRYALKLLSRNLLSDPAAVRRFEIEMESLAKVDGHPGIVRVHSAGRTEKGVPYFAMEYVEGQSLGRSMKEGRLDRDAALDVVEQIARALAFAHSKGLVHRDVKPDNVLIGEDGVARLSDFGLVRFLGREEGITKTKDVVGTPFYLAPEQANKRLGEVGAWTDVYGLGAMLYEVLVGEVPHTGKTSVEVVEKVLSASIVPVRQRQPDVGVDVERVCMKALERRPGRRYQSAGELADELGQAREAWRRERSGGDARPAGRGPLYALAAVAAASLLGLAVVLGLLMQRGRARAARANEVEQAAVALASQVRARRDYDVVIDRGELLLAEIDGEDDPVFAGPRDQLQRVVERARIRLAELKLRLDDVAGAWEALGERVPELEREGFDGLPVVLALAAPPEEALAFASGLGPAERARLAAWAGDRGVCLQALGELDPWRAWGLAHALRPYVPDLVPPVEPPAGDARWQVVARGERALARGLTPLAALAFAEVEPGSESELAVARALGLAGVHLARGEPEALIACALEAWQAAEGPFERARCLAFAAAGARMAGRSVELPEGEDVWAVARRMGPGLPLLRALDPDEPRARDGRLERAREIARGGDLEAACAATRACAWEPGPAGACFSSLERAAAAGGVEGPSGILLARGCRLAEAAVAGGLPASAAGAEGLLAQARLFHPRSPALHVALARVARLRGDCAAALALVEAGLALAPGDAGLLIERACARQGQAQRPPADAGEGGAVYQADLARLTDGRDEGLEAAAAEAADETVAAWEEALAASSESGEEDRTRLALGMALLERQRRQPTEVSGSLPEQEALVQVLSPLLAGLDVQGVATARASLARALEQGDEAAVTAAEDALARRLPAGLDAPRLTRVLRALWIWASAGLPRAQEHAQTLLALGGDLPARALEHLEREVIETQGSGLERAHALAPWLPQPRILTAARDREPGAATLQQLARLALEGPEWAGLMPYLAAYAAPSTWGQDVGLEGLEAQLDDGSVLGLTARGLAALQRLRPDSRTFQGADAHDRAARVAESDPLGRRALESLWRARQLAPDNVGLELLAAHCLQRVGARADGLDSGADPWVMPDAAFALACARASQPWSSGDVLVAASLAEDEGALAEVIARGLALGYTRSSRYLWVRDRDRRGLVERLWKPLGQVFGRGTTDASAARLLTTGKRVARSGQPWAGAVLCLAGWRRQAYWVRLGVALGAEAEVVRGMLGGDALDSAWEGWLVEGGPRAEAFGRALVRPTAESALRAWSLRAPPGEFAPLGEHATRAAGRLFHPTQAGADYVRQLAFSLPDGLAWAAHYRLWQPATPLASLAALQPGPGPGESLREPWSRAQLLLQAPQSRWAIEESLAWLIQTRAWDELRLGLERAAAFSRSDSGYEARVGLGRWLRATAGRDELAPVRARLLRLTLEFVRGGLASCPYPQVLIGLAADLQLDLCALVPQAERSRWVEGAVQDAERAAQAGVPHELERFENAIFVEFRRLRALVAAGRAEDAREGLRRLQEAVAERPDQGWSLALLRLWHARDPLGGELEEMLPELEEVLRGS